MWVGLILFALFRSGAFWFVLLSLIWFGAIWFHLILFGLFLLSLIWFGLVVKFGYVWFDEKLLRKWFFSRNITVPKQSFATFSCTETASAEISLRQNSLRWNSLRQIILDRFVLTLKYYCFKNVCHKIILRLNSRLGHFFSQNLRFLTFLHLPYTILITTREKKLKKA